ncbi:MAG: rhodanese-like domain-containing protein [Bacteroidetes bacterium]|nr:MAG: rhodanese-like domain-containing protein [Bacteroidota bacterium]
MKDIFRNYGIVSSGILNVSPEEAFELVKKGALIVDIREENLRSFKGFNIPEVVYFPLSKLMDEYYDLPSDTYLIFADTVRLRSKEAVVFLKGKGFKRIANMAGGLVDWGRDGLPVTEDISSRLSGSCMCQLKPRENKKKATGNRLQANANNK